MPKPAPDEHDHTLREAAVLAGQYEIVRKLGEGGMGEVHLAKDRYLNDRLVAIKTLPSLRAASKRAMKQLRAEAAAMADLTHEHIVRFFHFAEHEGLPFFVMQYVNGQTLDDLLEEKETLTVSELLPIARPVAEALDYAHSKGVIHKDIKPANIFIDENGKPYLADFGIARVAKDTITQVTGRDTTAGTLQYMSPEQCRGEWNLTPASDVYSFATMLYECLAGHVPFRTGPIRELIINEEPPPLPDGTPLAGSVMRGLRKSPKDRPGTVGEILQDDNGFEPPIELPLAGFPLTAEEASNVQRETAEFLQVPVTEILELGNGVTMEFVLIPAGEFMMGSLESEAERKVDEGPRHLVRISRPLYLGKCEVTQAQWQAVMGKNPSHFTGDACRPVEQISWNDCQEFCRKLSQRVGREIRLPTEAEWEYACRAGTTTAYSFGDDASHFGEYSCCGASSGRQTHPVGQKLPNPWGLHDMHGNVWEWCQDRYGRYPSSAQVDPSGPDSGYSRVLRGGSWYGSPGTLRSAYRVRNWPDDRGINYGFRVAAGT